MENNKLNGFNNGRDTTDGVGGGESLEENMKWCADNMGLKETKTLQNKVFEALGEVSMCWSETPKGVFESSRAEEIGNKLMKNIEEEIGSWREVSQLMAKEAEGKFFLLDTKYLPDIKNLDTKELMRIASQQGIQVVVPKMNIKEAIEVLCNALREDKSEGSLYHAYQCNIAMAYLDNERWYKDKTGKKTLNRKDKHEIANNAAKYFLNLLINK